VAALVDRNILVYCFDPDHPAKQHVAVDLLREHARRGAPRIPHQALVEFVSVVTRPRREKRALLTEAEAWSEAENLVTAYPVLYPTEAVLRTAFRGAAVYRLSWFDAHIWAYAECFELTEIYSEDFQHGRLYGTVKAVNPFL
jgi:predicted nucleic acid-binding protein